MTAPTEHRRFTFDGEEWLAWPSGAGAYGTGALGGAHVQAVHFARAADEPVPTYEALLPVDRFWGMFDEELIALFRNAVRVVDASAMPAPSIRRRSRSLEERPGPGGDRERLNPE